VIDESTIPVEPWQVRELRFDIDQLAQSESLFALGNGHIGLRGNLDEGEPYGIPGSYLNSFFESRPMPYAEAGYGFPESGQTVVNVTNGKIIRLLVDDEPFDVRYGELHHHERVLDLRAGTLTRRVRWTSPAGRTVQLTSVRIVSLSQRAVAAIRYEVEPVDGASRIILQSELVTNEAGPAQSGDPRVAAILDRPLVAEDQVVSGDGAVLVHSTRRSGLRMGAAMTHLVEGPPGIVTQTEAHDDWARTTVTCLLKPGTCLTLTKFLAYGWSSERSLPAMRDQVSGALAGATAAGWDDLLADQRRFLDEFWDAGDVEIDGDGEVQQAVRFALFHLLQSGARAEQRAIPAKGLTGPGYDGHAFWDTETFVLPVLTYIRPEAVRDALRWRHSTLGMARDRAHQLGFRGAAFPWRTIDGQECSGYWPAGTAAFHVNADIADAVLRYAAATGDEVFEQDYGLELLIEIARLLRSLGHHDGHGRFHIDGVTGPDEYTALCDDNVYTNLMAQRALAGAADATVRYPDRARVLGVDREEAASWRDAASMMFLPYDADRGVHQQCEGFTHFQEWDFAATTAADYPLLLHRSYFDLYRKQVIKQADIVLAMHLRSDAFSWEDKARNFDYYERRTVRDSSLSACSQAIVAADVGHTRLAYDYLAEAALMDLRDIEHNTSDGLHMASLAGAWLGLVAGFGGLRDHGGALHFNPVLPDGLTRMAFSVHWRGTRLRVEVAEGTATYSLRDHGGSIRIFHLDEEITVSTDAPVTMKLQRADPLLPEPVQPAGRAPKAHGLLGRT
jgi:alpha,alpha-trehalose phosphorylase